MLRLLSEPRCYNLCPGAPAWELWPGTDTQESGFQRQSLSQPQTTWVCSSPGCWGFFPPCGATSQKKKTQETLKSWMWLIFSSPFHYKFKSNTSAQVHSLKKFNPRELKIYKKTCLQMFKRWKEAALVSRAEWINTTWSVHTVNSHLAFKGQEILTHATTWRNLEDIMLCEVSPSQKGKHHMNPLMWST